MAKNTGVTGEHVKQRKAIGHDPLASSPTTQFPPLALQKLSPRRGCLFLGLVPTLAGNTRASECVLGEGMVAATQEFLALQAGE